MSWRIHEFKAKKKPPFWTEAYAQGYRGNGWYFWDETDAHVVGPYETKELAEKALVEYEP